MIRILLVEDNIGYARKIKNLIDSEKSIDFDVVTAKFYKTALERIQEEEFDVILYSLNNYEDKEQIENIFKLSGTPIIALTLYSLNEEEKKRLKNSTFDVLHKSLINQILLIRTILLAKEYKKFILYRKIDTSKVKIKSKKDKNIFATMIGLITSILEFFIAYSSNNNLDLITLNIILIITFLFITIILIRINNGDILNE